MFLDKFKKQNKKEEKEKEEKETEVREEINQENKDQGKKKENKEESDEKEKKVEKDDEEIKRKKSTSFKKPVDLRNPEVLDVNLVKDEIVVFFNWRKHLTIAFIVIALTSLFIYEISRVLDYWEEIEIAKAEQIEKQIEVLKKDTVLMNNKASNALLFKEKSLVFSKLLGDHIYFSNFFTWLEKNTLSSVKYSGFSGDISGDYSLQATAPSYAEVSWQAKVLSDSSYIKDVEIASANLVENTVVSIDEEGEEVETSYTHIAFTLSFTVEQSIFLNK
ncbi:MAG: hypothetical protein PF488_01705 [Patescibacteria group bacterium]|jgi:hypothetical protein|nr:hypothetical protein [Patescibacteria group bacterium]